jgi:hypothetical protein
MTAPPLDLDAVRAFVHITDLGSFTRAAERQHIALTLTPAPLGVLRPGDGNELSDYLPSAEGLQVTVTALHEWLGRLAGA